MFSNSASSFHLSRGGTREGDSIKDYTKEKREDALCMELLASTKSVIDEFLGKVEESNPNSGVVEIDLNWDKPELDFDLVVVYAYGFNAKTYL
ncbi:MAG: hypothetical protein PHS10_03255 [Thiovulaceae bacterium]|nr:hypothetical protein [Sulfurimonadaceae bacterium]